MSKTKQSTQDLILAEADKIAQAEGLDAVSHKVIATALGKSSSNIVYYYPKATDLRRATALQLIERLGRPSWGVIEFWVTRQLPETHRAAFHDGEPHPTDEEMQDERLCAEAFLWLARHGMTAPPVEAEGE